MQNLVSLLLTLTSCRLQGLVYLHFSFFWLTFSSLRLSSDTFSSWKPLASCWVRCPSSVLPSHLVPPSNGPLLTLYGNHSFSSMSAPMVQGLLFYLCTKYSKEFFKKICIITTPEAYESSQTRGWIRAEAAGLHHSHSNAGSELCLRPAPQLTAPSDP